MKTIIAICLIAVLFAGCASLEKFVTPERVQMAVNAVVVAQELLKNLDTVYEALVKMKYVPDYTTEATRALAMADAAAEALKAIIAGKPVTDAELNVIAGQVDGAIAIANQMKQ